MAGYEARDYAQGDGLYVEFIQGGATITAYSLVYLDANSQWQAADADAASTMNVVGLATEPLRASQKGRVLLQGFAASNSWMWTAGGAIYASTTAGGLTQTKPSGTGDVVQQVGIAVSATLIYFDPKLTGDLLSIEDYEVQTGVIAEPTVTSRGNGHSVAVYNSTEDRLFKWIRGNGDTEWYGVELL